MELNFSSIDCPNRAPMALIPVFIILFAAWMLWGWLVSDVRDIRWMRKWCAILFVVTAILISVAAGAGVTMVVAKRQFRQDFHEFATAMKKQVDAGNHRLVAEELNLIVNPDAEAPGAGGDVLHRMQASKTRLQSGQQKTSTATSSNPRIRVF